MIQGPVLNCLHRDDASAKFQKTIQNWFSTLTFKKNYDLIKFQLFFKVESKLLIIDFFINKKRLKSWLIICFERKNDLFLIFFLKMLNSGILPKSGQILTICTIIRLLKASNQHSNISKLFTV